MAAVALSDSNQSGRMTPYRVILLVWVEETGKRNLSGKLTHLRFCFYHHLHLLHVGTGTALTRKIRYRLEHSGRFFA